MNMYELEYGSTCPDRFNEWTKIDTIKATDIGQIYYHLQDNHIKPDKEKVVTICDNGADFFAVALILDQETNVLRGIVKATKVSSEE